MKPENNTENTPGSDCQERLVSRLLELPEDARHAVYVDMNCWRWPTALSEFAPPEWETLNHQEMMDHPSAKALWKAIDDCTTEYGRSQAWWEIELKETREAHAQWWHNGKRRVSSANAEVSHRDRERQPAADQPANQP